jgi:hypothetical protein
MATGRTSMMDNEDNIMEKDYIRTDESCKDGDHSMMQEY